MAAIERDKPFLFQMLGFPGSGKSYVSQWLAPHMRAVHLQNDSMRIHMFGEERLELHTQWRFQKQVHAAMQYAASQVLAAGHSVVYDANHTAVKHRLPMRRIAEALYATPILVWVKIPLELAKQRVMAREAGGGMKVFELDFVDRMASNLEAPESTELYIEIDGEQLADQQLAAFERQFAVILAGKVQ